MTIKSELIAVVIIIAALALIAGIVSWDIHERSLGKQAIEAADARATQKAQAAAKVQTDALALQARKAAQDASHAQAVLTAYMSAHPVEPVRLCYQNLSSQRVPETPAASGGTKAASARPATGGQMSPGGITQSVDISSELGTIVRSFGSLAIEVTEFQQRQSPLR